MLGLSKNGAEVVNEAPADPDGARISSWHYSKGGKERGEEDMDRKVHHEDGDPDAGALGSCGGRRLGLLHRLDA